MWMLNRYMVILNFVILHYYLINEFYLVSSESRNWLKKDTIYHVGILNIAWLIVLYYLISFSLKRKKKDLETWNWILKIEREITS